MIRYREDAGAELPTMDDTSSPEDDDITDDMFAEDEPSPEDNHGSPARPVARRETYSRGSSAPNTGPVTPPEVRQVTSERDDASNGDDQPLKDTTDYPDYGLPGRGGRTPDRRSTGGTANGTLPRHQSQSSLPGESFKHSFFVLVDR